MSDLNFLTSDEIQKIVENTFNTKNVNVVDYSIKPFSDKLMGFLGEHFRLIVDISVKFPFRQNTEKIKKNYFIKIVPRGNPKQSEYLTSSGAFPKEVECYDKFFYDVSKAVKENNNSQWHPKYFYGREDIIVLEDLTPLGFQLYPEREPLDLDHAKIVLKTLATMHGHCLVFEEKISKGEITSVSPNFEKLKNSKKIIEIKDLYPLAMKEIVYNKEEPENKFTKWMQIGPYQIGEGISEALEGYNESERLKIRKELPKIILELYELTEYSKKFKNIFCQGDGWTNNFLFRYKNSQPVEARVLDYQLSRYMPPVHDFLEILYLSVTRELRERHEKELSKFYYEELEKVVTENGCDLSQIISWESFLESLEHYRKLGLARASILLNIVLTPNEVLEKGFETIEEYQKFILNERGSYIKKCFQYDYYKKRNSEMFNELIQRYIL